MTRVLWCKLQERKRYSTLGLFHDIKKILYTEDFTKLKSISKNDTFKGTALHCYDWKKERTFFRGILCKEYGSNVKNVLKQYPFKLNIQFKILSSLLFENPWKITARHKSLPVKIAELFCVKYFLYDPLEFV